MRRLGLNAIALIAAFPILTAADATPKAAPEPPPKTTWNEIRGAYQVQFAEFTLRVPPGYRLCVPPPPTPISAGVIIPLDPSIGCDQFDQKTEESQWPDRLQFVEPVDLSSKHHSVEELARDECAKEAGPAATVKPAGKVFGGLEAITCIVSSADVVNEITFAHHPFPGREGWAMEPRLRLVAHKANADQGHRVMVSALAGLQAGDLPQRPDLRPKH